MDWSHAYLVVLLLMPGGLLGLACIVFTFWYQGNERTEILQPVPTVPKAAIPILGANVRTIRKVRAAVLQLPQAQPTLEQAARKDRIVALIHATQSDAEAA